MIPSRHAQIVAGQPRLGCTTSQIKKIDSKKWFFWNKHPVTGSDTSPTEVSSVPLSLEARDRTARSTEAQRLKIKLQVQLLVTSSRPWVERIETCNNGTLSP
jgi:hypothetical protein